MMRRLKNFLQGWRRRKMLNESDLQKMKPEELEAIANLVGTTVAELKAVDGNIVGDKSAAVRALKINPHKLLKDVINSNGGPPQQEHRHQEEIPRGDSPEVSSQHRAFNPPAQNATAIQMVMLDTATVQGFKDEIEGLKLAMSQLITNIQSLQSTETAICNVLETSLKKGAKTITFKFNDSQDNQ